VQRGPQGETAFVNNFYSFTNDGWFWKQIWADDDHIAQATEQIDPTTGTLVPLDYYEHKDLQGSVNVVTDQTGAEFEHMEYFPSGEIWIHENSTTHRTPYRFVGDLNDEVRNLDVLGQRWYQPREQVFYRPEPLLTTQGEQAIDDPGLLSAYSYAEANPLRLYDSNGSAPEGVLRRLRGLFSPQSKFVVEEAGRPNTPSITVSYARAATGAHLGGNATLYVSYIPNADRPDVLDYHKIELIGSWTRENGVNVIGSYDKYEYGWPDPQRSTTWEVSNDAARDAVQYARNFRRQQDDYTVNYYGIGENSYNSAKFAEEVLQDAGISVSSGVIFASGEKLVTGQVIPRNTVSNALSSLMSNIKDRASRVRKFFFGTRPTLPPIDMNEIPARYRDY
jgi:RHS repeat-associated protein